MGHPVYFSNLNRAFSLSLTRKHGWYTSGTLRKRSSNLTVQFVLSLGIGCSLLHDFCVCGPLRLFAARGLDDGEGGEDEGDHRHELDGKSQMTSTISKDFLLLIAEKLCLYILDQASLLT